MAKETSFSDSETWEDKTTNLILNLMQSMQSLQARIEALEKTIAADAELQSQRAPLRLEAFDRIASALEVIAKKMHPLTCPRCNLAVVPSLGMHLCPDGKAP